MQAFNSDLFLTTSEAAELLDVHPSTVKRWSDGGDLRTRRTEGGHRRIYLRDIIDFAAEREVVTYLDPFRPFESHVWLAVRDAVHQDDFERMISLSLGWLVRGYPWRITALIRELGRRGDLSLARVCDGAIRPLMARVGEAWRAGRLRIGEEHMASQAAMEALICLTQGEPAPTSGSPGGSGERPGPVAVVGSLEGDHHHLGALCARAVLERAGWSVFYPGPDTPAEEFASIQRARKAELICISFSSPGSAAHMLRSLDVLREFYRAEAPYDLLFGSSEGPAPGVTPGRGPFRSFRVLTSMTELASWDGERKARLLPGPRRAAG